MNDSLSYTIREMQRDDIPAAVAFYNELAEAEQLIAPTTVADYSIQFGMATAAYETRLLAHLTNADGSEGKLVGYSLVVKGDLDRVAWTLLHVIPAYRKRGSGSAVLAWQVWQLVAILEHELGFAIITNMELPTVATI